MYSPRLGECDPLRTSSRTGWRHLCNLRDDHSGEERRTEKHPQNRGQREGKGRQQNDMGDDVEEAVRRPRHSPSMRGLSTVDAASSQPSCNVPSSSSHSAASRAGTEGGRRGGEEEAGAGTVAFVFVVSDGGGGQGEAPASAQRSAQSGSDRSFTDSQHQQRQSRRRAPDPASSTPLGGGGINSSAGSSGAFRREGEVRAVLAEVDRVGQTMGSSKLKYSWLLEIREAMCQVELFHSRVSGKKKLFVNGVLIRLDVT